MKIILVVGPSGSGKDTLLRSARAVFERQHAISFSKRYITRPPDNNEDNYYVDLVGFEHLSKTGFFISTWRAHNNFYGIPHHIFSGDTFYSTVVCSISRSAIGDFERHYANTTTISITAEENVLRQRLSGRGRENTTDIEKRLQRAQMPIEAEHLITFDNSMDIEISARLFTALLSELIHNPPQYSENKESYKHSIQ